MKTNNLFAALALTTGLLFGSCNSDTNTLKIQKHDDSELMGIMHTMMDEMNGMAATQDPDHDFAMMMRMHHQGAINMAEYQLSNGDDAEMKAIATEMKAAQQAEIQELTTFLNGHTPDTVVAAFMEAHMASMERMGDEADLQVITGDTDHDFAALMIPHHRSAMEMAQSELDYGNHEELKEMARMMIEMQREEIKKLQDWLVKNKDY